MEARTTSGGDRLVAARYRLLAPLGSGGMGTVWRARDELLGREVAVKEMTFPPGVSDAERAVLSERTRREARAAARLVHPSAVTVYDVADEDGQPFLVMELVEARTLADVVRTDGPLSPERTAAVGLAVLGALRAAHAEGIVHRDVKPGNVLLADDGRVVLTDFGIATSTGDSSLTSTGLLLGSPAYIAPERARGEAPGPASDLWSLGATLFTAVEGRPPFDGGEPLLTVTAVVTGDHAPFVSAGPLAPVLEGLLERDPQLRLDPVAAARLLEQVQSGTAPRPGPAAAAAAASAAATTSPSTPAQDERAQRTSALPLGAVHASAAAVDEAPAAAPALRPGPGPAPAPVRAAPVRAAALPPRTAGKDRRVPVALAAVALMAVAGLGAVALSRGDDPGGSAAGPSASGTARPSAPASGGATGSAGAGAAAVPADWKTFTDPAGWSVRYPPSWSVSNRNGLQQFRDDQTRRTLRIDTTTRPKADPVADWRTQAKAFARTHEGYQELSIAAVDYRDYDAADWEFRYRDAGADLRVVNRGFVVGQDQPGARGYAIYWQTRDGDWEDARPVFEQLAAGFRPA